MSFIPRRNLRLFEKSVSLRRELSAFLFLVTFWALAVSLFSNMAFAAFGDKFQWWAQHHRALAFLVLACTLAGLAWGVLMALASGVIGSFEEVRRFHIVLPVAISSSGARIVPVREYRVVGKIGKALAREEDAQVSSACQDAVRENPGRPFTGRFYEYLVSALTTEMISSLADSCKFLLSEDSEFHGFDYGRLAEPPGPCKTVPVPEMENGKIHLPSRCAIRIEPSPPDRYGKRTKHIVITAPFGKIVFAVWPQWAVLSSSYNGRSLKFAHSRLEDAESGWSQRNGAKLPSLWVLEIPVEMRVVLAAGWKPHLFMGSRFELFASWACDLLDRTEASWSWEAFVDRCYGEPAGGERADAHGPAPGASNASS